MAKWVNRAPKFYISVDSLSFLPGKFLPLGSAHCTSVECTNFEMCSFALLDS